MLFSPLTMLLGPPHSPLLHHVRNFSLIGLSLLLLPFSLSVVLLARVLQILRLTSVPIPQPVLHHGRQVRILVTGVGMAKGLFLTRALHLGGCIVIAADFARPANNTPCGRFSTAVTKYYSLQNPARDGLQAYIDQVVGIVQREEVDLWISCSGVGTAVADGQVMGVVEGGGRCRAFQLNEDAVGRSDDKLRFMRETAAIGLPAPVWYALGSIGDALATLEAMRRRHEHPSSTKGLRFIVKYVGVDDASRDTSPILDSTNLSAMKSTLLGLDYDRAHSWILQEYLDSGEEYCTHAVVVRGHITAFTACPSASVLMHYQPLDPRTWLYREMLSFTREYAAKLMRRTGQFTGHLSFDFLVRYVDEDGLDDEGKKGGGRPPRVELVPIECNPRCHTATILFRGREEELTRAYLAALADEDDDVTEMTEMLEVDCYEGRGGYYWMAHDLVVLGIAPVIRWLMMADPSSSPRPRAGTKQQLIECVGHFLRWKDPSFEWWDPWPWFVLNHVYWPLDLLVAGWMGVRWKQLNVSTTKMFVC